MTKGRVYRKQLDVFFVNNKPDSSFELLPENKDEIAFI